MAKILIIRFSALGDVAMSIPVIYSFAEAYPQHEIIILSRKSFQPMFLNLPPNVRYMRADLSDRHRGLVGLINLYDKLKFESFDYVVDLHGVLRSKYLCFRFKLSGVKTAAIDKGRKEKEELTRKEDKKLVELKSVFDRYYEVFEKLGFSFQLNFKSLYKAKPTDVSGIYSLTNEKNDQKWVGIAPFAKHPGKVYPEALQAQVIEKLAQDTRLKVFIFGGGLDEQKAISVWLRQYPSLVSTISKLRMDQQLLLMSQLDLMISMDSGNMHLASLVGTPVVSIWGATHPYAGFMGWNQSTDNAVQVDLPCRPCSVYGQKGCFRGDYACLNKITPEMILNRIEENLFPQK